jgi:hypothetical protein
MILSPCASAHRSSLANVRLPHGAVANMAFPANMPPGFNKNSPVNLAIISSFAVSAF